MFLNTLVLRWGTKPLRFLRPLEHLRLRVSYSQDKHFLVVVGNIGLPSKTRSSYKVYIHSFFLPPCSLLIRSRNRKGRIKKPRARTGRFSQMDKIQAFAPNAFYKNCIKMPRYCFVAWQSLFLFSLQSKTLDNSTQRWIHQFLQVL